MELTVLYTIDPNTLVQKGYEIAGSDVYGILEKDLNAKIEDVCESVRNGRYVERIKVIGKCPPVVETIAKRYKADTVCLREAGETPVGLELVEISHETETLVPLYLATFLIKPKETSR